MGLTLLRWRIASAVTARAATPPRPKFICFSASITRVLSRSGARPGRNRTQLRREYSVIADARNAAHRVVGDVDRGDDGRPWAFDPSA